MSEVNLLTTEEQPQSRPVEPSSQPPQQLYVLLEVANASLKIGTCQHCVIQEPGRPARATDAEGDQELDFDREGLIAGLEALGIRLEIEEQYVCP